MLALIVARCKNPPRLLISPQSGMLRCRSKSGTRAPPPCAWVPSALKIEFVSTVTKEGRMSGATARSAFAFLHFPFLSPVTIHLLRRDVHRGRNFGPASFSFMRTFLVISWFVFVG